MSYTVTDYDRLRKAVGASPDVLDDSEAGDIFTEAATLYAGAASVRAATRVIAISNIMADAAKLTDYQQNNTQQSAGQVFDHLNQLLDFWQTALNKAVVEDDQAASSGNSQSVRVQVMSSW